MAASENSPILTGDGNSPSTDAEAVYKQFLDSLNRGDLRGAQAVVDQERWREICVGFTSGVIEWPQSQRSMERVWNGIPDLRFEPAHVVSDGKQVVAIGEVHGRQSGRLFGAPATHRSYTVSMFDYVRVEDGRIVERIQQADVLGQMRQLFGPLLTCVIAMLALVVLGCGVLIGALAA
jgi:predicted ester cyclase